MIKRMFINNFRCFLNFEFLPGSENSLLLIGHNGAGKSTVLEVLQILQRIAKGDNIAKADDRKKALIDVDDFGFQGTEVPIRFEIEVILKDRVYRYELALELPLNFKLPRVSHESLQVDGEFRFKRELANMSVFPLNRSSGQFSLDWHSIGLPIIQRTSDSDPVAIFKDWLSEMILLSPIPSLMTDEAINDNNEHIKMHGENIASWISNILATYPRAYGSMEKFYKTFFPDFSHFVFDPTGKNTKELELRFANDAKKFSSSLTRLSDGEKCILLGAAVYADAKEQDCPFCFWDEPNNYLDVSILDQFFRLFRKEFAARKGQFIVISHDLETVGGFNDENTWLFERRTHLESTVPPIALDDLRKSGRLKGSLRNALTSGDIYGS